MLRYLAERSTLTEFEDWIVENTWDAHLTDPGSAELGYTIKRLIAEHTSGHRSEFDLRLSMVPIAQEAPWGQVHTVSTAPSAEAPKRRFVLQQVA